MSRIAMVGAGYVGLTTGACFADLGHHVVLLDVDRAKLDALAARQLPIFEPGLDEVVARNLSSGRLDLSADYAEAIPNADFAFIAVATPPGERGEADLTAVKSAATSIATHMTGPLIIVNKSTVPIGTGDLVSATVAEVNGRHPVAVVSNPEFLREGSALKDFMEPDRVVIGAHDHEAADRVARLYQGLPGRLLLTDLYSAEMIKYASNAFLATRISFINEMARISERVGADIKVVAEGMGLDRRIGARFLEAGLGFGGSCLPKDVQALAAIGERYDYHPELLQAVLAINRDQRRLVLDKLMQCVGEPTGLRIAMLGLSFKPDTDDMREAPSVDLARELLRRGATVVAYDPVAMPRAQALLPGVEFAEGAYAAAKGADALILVTEWEEFRRLELRRLKRIMRRAVVVDGRNAFDPAEMRRAGFVYRGVGR